MTTIREMYRVRPPKAVHKAYAGAPDCKEQIQSKRLVGIEVEVENLLMKANPTSGVWNQTQDGSLRNNGAEWITLPIEARLAPYALRELLADGLHEDCCFSPRTSTHVHVNCQDLEAEQVTDIVLMYACLEPLFYQFTGRGRIKNIYCVPLHDTDLCSGIVQHAFETSRAHWSKYTGLNLVPLVDKGTLEFRQMHGTFDHEKLTIWIRLITKLVDYVIAKGTTTVRKFVAKIDDKADVFGLLMDIFGEQDIHHFPNTTYDAIKVGVENAKTAFIQQNLQTDLMRQRNLKAPYFKKG